jgi:hypothetical protein
LGPFRGTVRHLPRPTRSPVGSTAARILRSFTFLCTQASKARCRNGSVKARRRDMRAALGLIAGSFPRFDSSVVHHFKLPPVRGFGSGDLGGRGIVVEGDGREPRRGYGEGRGWDVGRAVQRHWPWEGGTAACFAVGLRARRGIRSQALPSRGGPPGGAWGGVLAEGSRSRDLFGSANGGGGIGSSKTREWRRTSWGTEEGAGCPLRPSPVWGEGQIGDLPVLICSKRLATASQDNTPHQAFR